MKKYIQNYRQRVYFCEKCNVRIEVLNSLSGARCHCCGVLVKELKKELDNDIEIKKKVTPRVGRDTAEDA